MRFFLFISVVQSILFLGHWFFYKTLVSFLCRISSPKLLTLRVAMGLLSVSLVLTSFLAFRYSNLPVRCLYTAAASWIGILYLFILASILSWILYALAKLLHFPPDRRVLIVVLIGIALAASLYGIINSGVTRITRLNLHIAGLPGQWKGKTAVWVSDTHLGQIRNFGFARRIADLVQGQHPDIVFIGGDLFDGVSVDPDRVIEPFSQLSSHYGTYFVTGNHEEFSDSSRYLQAVRRNGIRILNNEKVEIDGLQIIGVDYGDSRREEQFRTILQKIGINPSKPSILLKHTPFHLDVARDQGISVQLSGHTHQGQVFLFHHITHHVYQGYDYGLRWFGDLLVYTSSGAG
ncbi:MAG: metallophosphoesterase, partial [Thermodesulfobacteriota bacterium]